MGGSQTASQIEVHVGAAEVLQWTDRRGRSDIRTKLNRPDMLRPVFVRIGGALRRLPDAVAPVNDHVMPGHEIGRFARQIYDRALQVGDLGHFALRRQ